MTPLEAVEPRFLPAEINPRWTERLDALLRVLHALTISEHPYAYLVVAEPRRIRSRV